MSRTVTDLVLISAAFAVSLGFGILTNSVRRAPLPLIYENRETRSLKAVSPEGGRELREPDILEFQAVLLAWKNTAALFVDAREASFFEDGHIPRAVNVPRDALIRAGAAGELADKARPLIVYCSGEDCEDSRIVAKGLLAMGHSKVSLYPGGWEEWSASGSPVEK